ncbi:MAG: HAMP domain-containing sensor histidine kinase [bacterium]|nr:HAMP domain-containing sensor histidine kinase [bacterium]
MSNKSNLSNQLLSIGIAIIGIMVVSLGIILPKNLLPIYENSIYNYLKQPLEFVEDDINNGEINTEIAYLYVTKDDTIITSDNLYDIIEVDNNQVILDKVTDEKGKFKYNNRYYYYNTSKTPLVLKIAITNDEYINKMRIDIFTCIILTVGITFVIVSALLLIWSNNLVNKIRKLKDKVDNVNNDNYNHKCTFKVDDELYSLYQAIEDMRIYLKEQEEYKNQMYQNISHDFKTPITVMKSYIEATEDEVETKENALLVIKEQVEKLEIKVHSLLYLNKINYIKDKKNYENERIDVIAVIQEAIDKFKMTRSDVKFEFVFDKKNTIFRGNKNMWEAIIDNILNNFLRYAEKKIKITVKNNKIILYNDGPNIDTNVMHNIFTPYEKGVKGVFGLGLSIVQKTLHLLNYDILIKNEKKGVKFTIHEP